VQSRIDRIARPSGYDLTVTGNFEEQQNAFGELLLSLLLGLMPLALGIGEGADAQSPLARTVVGGACRIDTDYLGSYSSALISTIS